jgi:glycosyltransferase involved in cell wall biosynthesis
MRILLVHQNFPGQFKHLAPALAKRGHEVVGLGARANPPPLPGVRVYGYRLRRGTTPNIHPWAESFESKMIRGEAAGRAADELRKTGFLPDVIYAHTGWGESFALKSIWPKARLAGFFEYYYHARGADVDFDPEFPSGGWADELRVEMKNAAQLMAMQATDAAVTPTEFQRSTFPAWFQRGIQVIHDGIDTGAAAPNPKMEFRVANLNKVFRPGDEVVTFVSRTLEPMRGYHVFLRALPEIMRRRPNAHIVVIGADREPGYGRAAPGGKTWHETLFAEVKDKLDVSRLVFLGRVPYDAFLGALRVSAVHVYLTYPFVLSWSLLEALSTGCLVVGSDTAPVREVIEKGKNGRLVDFFDRQGLADAVVEGLAKPEKFRKMRKAARDGVLKRYDLGLCLPKQIRLLEKV